jgi:hypothetical protein
MRSLARVAKILRRQACPLPKYLSINNPVPCTVVQDSALHFVVLVRRRMATEMPSCFWTSAKVMVRRRSP